MRDLVDGIEEALRGGEMSRDEILFILREHPAIESSSTKRGKGEKLRRALASMDNVKKVGETVATKYRLTDSDEETKNHGEIRSTANKLVWDSLRHGNGVFNLEEQEQWTNAAIEILVRRGVAEFHSPSGVYRCTGKAISFESFEKKLTSFSLPSRSMEAIDELADELRKMANERTPIKYLEIIPPSDPNKSTIVALALEILLCVVRKHNATFAET